MRNLIKVLVPNGVTLGVTVFTNIELALKIGLLLASIAYTVLHCMVLWRQLRKKGGLQDPES